MSRPIPASELRIAPAYRATCQDLEKIVGRGDYVGAVQVFDEAGFTAVSAPTERRRVTRIDV